MQILYLIKNLFSSKLQRFIKVMNKIDMHYITDDILFKQNE